VETITELLYRLVAVRSDTGSVYEREMAEEIYKIIGEHRYFIDNPEMYGKYMGGDILDRPVVWALKKGTGSDTLVITGHYDTVGIDSYGVYEPYALEPDKLKFEFTRSGFGDARIREDLNDPKWAFGRGIADMKAGLAIGLKTLFNEMERKINILFVAVPDEENMSSGAIMSIELYHQLRDKFSLDYKMAIVPEPESHDPDRDIEIIGGSMGKFMPIIVVKGILTHAGYLMKGLNSGFVISDIIRSIEMDKTKIYCKDGVYTQPPTVQIFRDLKQGYDVSVPEYSAALFNFMFLKLKTPNSYIEDLRSVCEKSMSFSISRYNDTFDYLVDQGLQKEASRLAFKPVVMTLSELEEYISEKKDDYSDFKEKLNVSIASRVLSKEITLQTASIETIKKMLEYSEITEPVAVIGISPPYYPAVANDVLGKDMTYAFEGLDEILRYNLGFGIKQIYSNLGMTDISYMSCTDPAGERDFLNNMTVPPNIYDIPVEKIAGLNIPTYKIGPVDRDIHKIGERVFLPDVEKTIPLVFEHIIENLSK
jgi:arginine utilization protein RocB